MLLLKRFKEQIHKPNGTRAVYAFFYKRSNGNFLLNLYYILSDFFMYINTRKVSTFMPKHGMSCCISLLKRRIEHLFKIGVISNCCGYQQFIHVHARCQLHIGRKPVPTLACVDLNHKKVIVTIKVGFCR